MSVPGTGSASARRRWLVALARVAAAVLLLGTVGWIAGPERLIVALREAEPRWLAAGLACAVGSNLASALRWRALVLWFGQPVSRRWAIAVYLRGVTANALLPGAVIGGDVLRAWSLHRLGCPRSRAGLSVLLDRLSGLWILLACAAAGVVAGAGTPELGRLMVPLGLRGAFAQAAAGGSALVLALLLPAIVLRGLRRRWGLDRPGAGRQYLQQAAASFAVQALAIGSLACAARAFGIGLPVWLVALTALPIFLLAAVPVGFGGWGTREAATAASWYAFGVAPPLAVAAAMSVGAYALVQAAAGLLFDPVGRARDAAPNAAV